MTNFHELLRYLRIKASLSQRDVAESLGLESGQFISNFERGACLPPLKSLPELASLYRVPLKRLFDKYSAAKKLREWEIISG